MPGPTPGTDGATARAINLVAGDLPGFLSGASYENGEQGADLLAHCAGAPSPADAHVVEVTSPTFTAAVGPAQEQISSEVVMMRTAAEADAEAEALRRPAVVGCLGTELGDELQSALPPGARLGPVAVSRFRPAGTTLAAVGLHLQLPVTATASGATARVVVSDDLVEFTWGRAVVSLNARTTGSASLRAQESRLTGLLAGRARRVHQ